MRTFKVGDKARHQLHGNVTVTAVDTANNLVWVVTKHFPTLEHAVHPMSLTGDAPNGPLVLRLPLATVSRDTDTSMTIEFWDRDDNRVAVVDAAPSELQKFAIRILEQVQYNLEDRER